MLSWNLLAWLPLAVLIAAPGMTARAAPSYQVYVTNERSGDITVINGGDFSVAATIPVGKRPRGIHASPDGKSAYVALSGTPIEAPPQIDAHGNPILVSGNSGHRVRETAYPRGRIYAYVVPNS